MEGKRLYCRNCGKQIPDGSTFCTECGAPQYATQVNQFSQTMHVHNKKKPGCLIALGVFAVIIILSIIIPSIDGSNEGKPVSTQASLVTPSEQVETPIQVSASDLYNQYDENEVNADGLYKDKLLNVSGVIDRVTVTFGQIQVIVGDGQQWSIITVYCDFEDDQSAAVSALKKGDNVVIQGRCRGKALCPSLDDCTIILES